MRRNLRWLASVLLAAAPGAALAQTSFIDARAEAAANALYGRATVRLKVSCAMPEDAVDVPAMGTAFIISETGLMLTARHVIAPALGRPECTISASGGTLSSATLIQLVDTDSGAPLDAALLSLPAGHYPFIPLGSDAALRPGLDIRVVGYDLGGDRQIHHGTVTAVPAGSASGVGRIPVDALFTQGASGGPIGLRMCDAALGMALAAVAQDGVPVPGQLRMRGMDAVAAALKLTARGVPIASGPCRPWPDELASGATFTISKADARRVIPYLELPADTRLQAAAVVPSSEWDVYLYASGEPRPA